MIETWKDICDYEGYYQVSDLGHVRSVDREIPNSIGTGTRHIKGQLLALSYCKKYGYWRVQLQKKNFKVHVLVLMAFVGPRPKGMDACHNDDNQDNNYLSNLRWDTRSHNLIDKFRNGYQNVNVRKVKRSDGVIFQSATQAANSVEDSQGNISRVCAGKRKSAKGFSWEYI